MIAPRRGRLTVRRIVVAADASPPARAALAAAVRLASQLEAELEGLFIEDVNLKRLAALPVGREIRWGGGFSARDAAAVAEDLQAEAAQIRRALQDAAARARVKASFRVLEGRVEQEVVAAAGAADLLVLGLTGRRISTSTAPGATALAAVTRSTHSVLVLRAGAEVGRRALVLYDGSAGAAQALDFAARVADDDEASLTVVLRAPDEAEALKLRRRAASRLARDRQGARFLPATAPTLADLCRAASGTGTGLLVISADDPLVQGEGARRLLEDVLCPVLLVR